MSKILSVISMLTGQISSHALQVVQAQISSGVIRSNNESALIVISESTPSGADTTGEPVAAMTSPAFNTISRGSSGLPVAWAGHTLVHRPHIVQASRSSNCFHVKSSTVEAPKLSSSVSSRFGIGRIAPFGRSLSFRYMFIGEVKMWRSIVNGSSARNATKPANVDDPHPLVPGAETVGRPAVDEGGERVADERPLLVVGHALFGDPEHLGAEAGHTDGEERGEDRCVLGLRLDADAVWPLHVTPDDRPDDATEEHESGSVADERIRGYVVPCRNFSSSGSWWLISSTVVTPSSTRNPK